MRSCKALSNVMTPGNSSDSSRDSAMPYDQQRTVPRYAFVPTTKLTDSASAITEIRIIYLQRKEHCEAVKQKASKYRSSFESICVSSGRLKSRRWTRKMICGPSAKYWRLLIKSWVPAGLVPSDFWRCSQLGCGRDRKRS